ncbi:pilus assembly protein TadG-related protein [Arthrobacter citreus]|uniref:pilus assembly protein TadG-related protein n=1 Tax=Arthrobacter citreus TaxID=1670 RepID=UPI0036DA2D83
MTRARTTADDGESGQVGVLIIGYVVLALLVITVIAGASSVYLGHKKLLSAADGAALAAADTFTLAQVQGPDGAAPVALLDSGRVTAQVQRYLQESGAGEQTASLRIEPGTGTPDGRTARVVLSGVVHPPIVNFLVPDGIRVTAESDARARLTR